MLILHASQQNGNLAVWAEDSQKHQPDTQGTNQSTRPAPP